VHANVYNGQPYQIHPIGPQTRVILDPPHDEKTIAQQLQTPTQPGQADGMGGFVASYMTLNPPPPDPSLVMGYYDRHAVPVFDFLARNFTVCDHWFAALPTGTQARRLMAMSGDSSIVDNAALFLADQKLVYDWLTDHAVTWCAYQSGDFLPFFSLMPDWLPEITTSLSGAAVDLRGRFRRYSRFREHWTGAETMPQVIFIEPEYTDGPHADPNDDHPPTGVAKGQVLLADIYNTIVSNPARWQKTLLIITYDEHGGFFDYVPPPPIPCTIAGFNFAIAGVRVPAFIVSPYVTPGRVFSGTLDHTAFLQLLADRFDPGQTYSAAVAARQPQLARLASALADPPVAPGPVIPQGVIDTLNATRQVAAAEAPESPGAQANAQAMRNAAAKALADHPELLAGAAWEQLTSYLASGTGS
jgi:phospholipase C